MPQSSPGVEKGRHSDPSTSAPSPLRGSFTRFSSRSRSRTLSPRKQKVKQPLHIRMDLTEMQMDRITDALTNKVNSSPVPSQHTENGTLSKSTLRVNKSSVAWQDDSPTRKGKASRSIYSPTFSKLMPGKSVDSMAANLAERRQREPPPSIRVNNSRPLAATPQRRPLESVPDMISPLSPIEMMNARSEYNIESSSMYSPEEDVQAMHSELVASQQYSREYNDINTDNDVLDMYQDWMQIRSPEDSHELANQDRGREQLMRPHHKSARELLRRDALPPSPPPTQPQSDLTDPHAGLSDKADENPIFSPLALYFRGEDFPTEKKGEKTMIGKNGWLERTGKNSPEKWKRTPQKKTGIIDSIKKMAKDMSELHHQTRRAQLTTKESGSAQVAISLNSREQSLLYCELEFHLTNALNSYINWELDKGHLVPDNLKKIADGWYQQGRPRVVGFRYDLETQLELISLHIDEFSFYGRRQGNPAEIAGLLHSMKMNARAMRIRTFCQPDSVIAKQLVDSQSLFNLINVSNAQQIALAEVAQFFKVILERERDRRDQKTKQTKD